MRWRVAGIRRAWRWLWLLAVPLPAWAGVPEGLAAYARGDFAAALREAEAPAAAGDPVARLMLGLLHLNGLGVPRDEAKALPLLRGAAEAGNPGAQAVMGRLYESGRAVAKDDAQAAQWYRKAAEQGHPRAQGLYGLMLSHGRGVPQHDADAVSWWQRAAASGDVDSQRWLGVAYADGSGVERNAERAYFWLLLAAARGGEGPLRYQLYRDRVERTLEPERRAAMQDAARDWRPATVVMPFLQDDVRQPTPPVAAAPDTGSRPSSPSAAPPSGRAPARVTGSGIVVAAGRVVTSRHVVQGCSRVSVGGQDVGPPIASDPGNDLALLSWQGPAAGAAAVRPGPAQIGEATVAAGFPLSGVLSGLNVTTGNVSGHAQWAGIGRMVQFTAPIQAGSSGGPLLDAAGSIVGVVTGKLRAARITADAPQNVNFAVSSDVLSAFLESHGVGYAKPAPDAAPLSTQDIARLASGFTVPIECWR